MKRLLIDGELPLQDVLLSAEAARSLATEVDASFSFLHCFAVTGAAVCLLDWFEPLIW